MDKNSQASNVSKIAGLLKGAKSMLFITGAGISSDSGLPTYRGIGGLYNSGVTDDGIPIETALSGEMLTNRPSVTWKYISQIEKNCRNAKFNRGHQVIAEMERHFERVWVLTQNIDGFHQQAGSKNVIDIHGDIHKIYCARCLWRAEVKDYSRIDIPPVCPKCGYIARPEVVFFGELLPAEKLHLLNEELARGFDIYFSIGTTSVFPYIQEPILNAKYRNKPAIEINPQDTEVSDLADIRLQMKAKEALDAVWNEYQKT